MFVRPQKRYAVHTGDKVIELDDHIMTQFGIEGIRIEDDDKPTFVLIVGGGDVIYDYQTERTLADFEKAHEATKEDQDLDEEAFKTMMLEAAKQIGTPGGSTDDGEDYDTPYAALAGEEPEGYV